MGGFIKDSVLDPRLTRDAQKLLYNFHMRLKKQLSQEIKKFMAWTKKKNLKSIRSNEN